MSDTVIERDEWTPTFREYLKRWDDLSPVERDVSIVVQDSIRANYMTEGSHSGDHWPRRTRAYPWPPLRRTGSMMSAQMAAAVRHWETSGDVHAMEFGEVITAAPYSHFHHDGTRHMPKRPTVRLSEEDVEKLTTILDEYLLKTA